MGFIAQTLNRILYDTIKMGDREYGFSLTTFSPSGKLVQIEYALNRVQQGSPALGIKAKNGVVIATEKKLPTSLIEDSSLRKIDHFTSKIGCVCAGMPTDYRVILKKGRKKAAEYELFLGEDIPVGQLVQRIAATMQEFTQSGGVRPFGLSLLVAGYDDCGPQLYQVDPSGAYFGWKASAIGRSMQNAKTFLEKRYNPGMELEDAIHTAILTLKEGFEGSMTEHNIEIGIVKEDRIFRILSPSEIKDYLEEVE
ncbi:putative proteasome subunit alpha2, protease of the acylase family and NTN hydrolase fold [Cardiosporidium cionae]|uniref:Proteasome subunit alpha2, protease of the acylase family and NTN hydrolase fold n=1 Tax=Cardiosporidium cionae TaxID=476202 RepID=A0ABQ7J3X9_9APIC|nr:putative proteasome subunit alpha2, protease of the acylase family and NTN hydrolase fold [Cardiosporidium cionae]|eukprot:KAF8817721.1 putative proteasome subunit alpha2, protease of the acylase family and NTN hydrolase fold [Cardiosporidium cionae]